MRSIDWRVYVITDRELVGKRELSDVVRSAIEGGATVVQYREKRLSTRQMIEESRVLREIAVKAGIPFIVNDRVDIALAVDADGVHLGQEDMPIGMARKILGPSKIIGASVSTVAEAIHAEAEGADYLGVGPVFLTGTKQDAGAPIGLEKLREICRAVSLPVVGIGGISLENAEQVIRAGAVGVAVVSAVMSSPDPAHTTRALLEIVERASKVED